MTKTILLTMTAMTMLASTAFADGGWSSSQMSDPDGDEGSHSSSDGAFHDPSDSGSSGPANDRHEAEHQKGGLDVRQFAPLEPTPELPSFWWRGHRVGADTVEYSFDEVKDYLLTR